jgi:AraC-like DNA-binding protein
LSKSDFCKLFWFVEKNLLNYNFSLLHADYVKLNKKWNYTNVISPYYRIYYIDEGEGFIVSKQDKVKLEPGYFYLLPSFTLCNLFCKVYLSQYFLHFFEESVEGLSLFENNRRVIKVSASDTDIANFKRLLEINPGRGINRSDNPKEYEKYTYYKSYQQLNKTTSDSTFFETQGIILQFISRFLNEREFKSSAPDPIASKILEAMRYIQMTRENLTVSYLAERANLHQDYFSRLFLRYAGQRPLSYIHEKRIERAQYLIATTDLSYAAIAEETGFETLSHFSKVFKKVTNLTPGEYKKQNRV